MKKTLFKCFSVLVVFLFLGTIGFGQVSQNQTETITLTTYYPSPHGSYMSLEVNELIVNDSLTVNGPAVFNDSLTVNGPAVFNDDVTFNANSHGSCTLKTLSSGDYSLECPDGYYVVGLHYEPPTWSDDIDYHSHPEIYRIKCCKL